MANKLIRYTGDAPRDEPIATGRRSRWWPGEVRAVSEAVALSLVGARQGWRIESPAGAPGALRKETADAVEALVAGDGKIPTLAWQLNGTRSVPAATFLGASTNGVFSLPTPILIPASQISLGKSSTEIEYTMRKTGSGTGGWGVKLGTTNGLSDTDIHPAIGSSFSATDPQEFTIKLRLTYSAGAVHVVGERRVSGSTAPLTDTKETAVTLTGDNYINLVLNSFSSGTNVALVSLSVRHFF